MRHVARWAGVVAGAVVLGWAAWSLRSAPVAVETGRVDRGVLMVTIDEDAHSRVQDRFVVHAPVAGELVRPELREGDRVEAGQVVARLVPRRASLLDQRDASAARARAGAAAASLAEQEARVKRAVAAQELAALEKDRQRALRDAGQVSARDADVASAAAESADAELEAARWSERVARFELEQAESVLAPPRAGDDGGVLELRSPVAARVLALPERSEGPVEAGGHLVELGDPRRLEVIVAVLSRDAVGIHVGSRVVLDRWGGSALAGVVRTVEPTAITRVSALGIEEQRVDVVVDLVSPTQAWDALGDGYALDAHVVTWESPDVTRVPAPALFRSGDGWSCFVVRDGRARIAPVVTGHRNASHAEVLAGLVSGDVVVLHPTDALTDGARVRILATDG